MSFGGTRLFTYPLTGSITIKASDGVLRASVIVETGTCTINGNYPFQALSSTPIQLTAGQIDSVSATGPNAPLDGITITASGGTTNVMLSF